MKIIEKTRNRRHTILKNPNEEMMSKLIERQWTRHSIQSAIVAPEGNIICIGETTVKEHPERFYIYKN